MAAAKSSSTAVSLPRYAFLRIPNSNASTPLYMALSFSGTSLISSASNAPGRLFTHEIVHYAWDEKAEGGGAVVVWLRASNRRYWELSGNTINVVREEMPGRNDTFCQFRVWLDPDQSSTASQYPVLLFQSLGAPSFLRRLQVVPADEHAFTLPRFVMFTGDNNRYIGENAQSGVMALDYEAPGLAVTHEVTYHPDGRLLFQNVGNGKVWGFPNSGALPVSAMSPRNSYDEFNKFDFVKLSDTLVSLRAVASLNAALRRDTASNNLIRGGETLPAADQTYFFGVKEALSSRTLRNVRYLLELQEVSDVNLVLVGSGSMRNNTDFVTSLSVTVTLTQSVTTSQSWSTSNTIGTSVSTSLTAGAPNIFSVSVGVVVGNETTTTTQLGEAIEQTVSFETTYGVPNVPPRTQVRVDVRCTTARLRVPFSYTSRDRRLDGVDLPSVENVDGIFNGVSAFDIHADITQVHSDGTSTKLVLPALLRTLQ